MGRAEKRRAERVDRIEKKKTQVTMDRHDIARMKRQISDDVSSYSTEALMTCFGLAMCRLYGFKQKRILKTLQYIDELMGPIMEDTATIEDYKNQLEEEGNVIIRC